MEDHEKRFIKNDLLLKYQHRLPEMNRNNHQSLVKGCLVLIFMHKIYNADQASPEMDGEDALRPWRPDSAQSSSSRWHGKRIIYTSGSRSEALISSAR